MNLFLFFKNDERKCILKKFQQQTFHFSQIKYILSDFGTLCQTSSFGEIINLTP